jgi:phage FluMu protein Com
VRGIETMRDLRCHKCNKKLAELEENYFEIVGEKNANRNQGKLFIKCPKCKEILAY